MKKLLFFLLTIILLVNFNCSNPGLNKDLNHDESSETLTGAKVSEDETILVSQDKILDTLSEAKAFEDETILVPSDGEDFFGSSVFISNNYAIVGAHGNSSGAEYSGAAYIFKFSNGTWSQEAALFPPDPSQYKNFGYAVSINSNYAVVGAPGDDEYGYQAGAIYIFKRNGSSWSNVTKLYSSNPDEYARLGQSVEIDRTYNYVIAGAPYGNAEAKGRGYVFELNSQGRWYQKSLISASDGANWDRFGNSVSISGNYAAVGNFALKGVYDECSVYIFKKNSSNGLWYQQAILNASDGNDEDYFGSTVSISGNRVVAGTDYGKKAYVFKRNSNNTWSEEDILSTNDSDASGFGRSVAIHGSRLLVGAPLTDNNEGRVYAFIYAGNGNWNQSNILSASNGGVNDYFGESLSIYSSKIIVAAPYYNDYNAGSAYIYE